MKKMTPDQFNIFKIIELFNKYHSLSLTSLTKEEQDRQRDIISKNIKKRSYKLSFGLRTYIKSSFKSRETWEHIRDSIFGTLIE